MLENQPKRSNADERSTIIIPIPIRSDNVSGAALMVTVRWEKEEPAYFINNSERISSQDFLNVINARLSRPQWAWAVLILGCVLSAGFALIDSEEAVSIYLPIGLFLTCLITLITYAVSHNRRKIIINYEHNEESRLAVAKLNAALTEIGKVAQVWDLANHKSLTIKSTSLPKIDCNDPALSFIGFQPKTFWMPDKLYILTGRTYQSYSYKHLFIESSTYRIEQSGRLSSDARIVSRRWLHQRKDGQADKRYRDNYQIPTVEYGALHFSTSFESLFKIGISNCNAVKQIAEAFRALAQSKPPVSTKSVEPLRTTHQPTPTTPAADPPQHLLVLEPQVKVKDVIYPLTASSKEVIYPLTAALETQNEVIYPLTAAPKAKDEDAEIARSDYKQFLHDARENHSQVGEPCEAVGFITYLPTYASLNKQQRRWYLYWRTEARKGHYLSTDSSYLFLHAYEVLNLVEKKDSIEAAGYLQLFLSIYENNSSDRF